MVGAMRRIAILLVQHDFLAAERLRLLLGQAGYDIVGWPVPPTSSTLSGSACSKYSFGLARERDFQRVDECQLARDGEIGGMQDRSDRRDSSAVTRPVLPLVNHARPPS
jgi:hypothetical protein